MKKQQKEMKDDMSGTEKGEIFVKGFKYIRESGVFSHLGNEKKEGAHTTADGVKKLFFSEDAEYSVEEFWTRLKKIIDAYMSLPGNELLSDSVDAKYGEMVKKRQTALTTMKESVISADTAYNSKDWFSFQNNVLEALNQFEIFSNLNPLVNISKANNKGSGEGTAIKDIKQNNDIDDNIAKLLDVGTLEYLDDVGLSDCLPWLKDDYNNKNEVKRLIVENHYHIFDAIMDGKTEYKNPIKGMEQKNLDKYINSLVVNEDDGYGQEKKKTQTEEKKKIKKKRK
jgi:hypothetical protein